MSTHIILGNLQLPPDALQLPAPTFSTHAALIVDLSLSDNRSKHIECVLVDLVVDLCRKVDIWNLGFTGLLEGVKRPPSFTYLDSVTGLCDNITSRAVVDVFYAKAGLSNETTLYLVAGAKITHVSAVHLLPVAPIQRGGDIAPNKKYRADSIFSLPQNCSCFLQWRHFNKSPAVHGGLCLRITYCSCSSVTPFQKYNLHGKK